MLQKDKRIKRPVKKSGEQALESLMRLCARAERSSGDAMRLMASWGVEPPERQKVLQRLIAERFIDDRRYASLFIKEKINLSAWGEYKIRTTLRTKGIAESIINEALADAVGINDSLRLQERLARKLKTIKADTPYKLKTKLIRYGLSLGYPTDSVIEGVEAALKQQNIATECDTDYIF